MHAKIETMQTDKLGHAAEALWGQLAPSLGSADSSDHTTLRADRRDSRVH